MAATAIALLLIGYFFIGGASSSSISQTTPDYYFGQVGSCYEEVSSVGGDKVQLVDCGSSNATLTSVEEVNSPYLCPDTSIYTTVAKLPDGTTRTACLSYNY
jgi:hypothetical protein